MISSLLDLRNGLASLFSPCFKFGAVYGIASVARAGPCCSQEFSNQRKSILLAAAGNRPDQFIIDSDRAWGGVFDRYMCTDIGHNLRGYQSGEVASLLARGMMPAGVPESAIMIEPLVYSPVVLAVDDGKESSLLVAEYHYVRQLAAALKAILPQVKVA